MAWSVRGPFGHCVWSRVVVIGTDSGRHIGKIWGRDDRQAEKNEKTTLQQILKFSTTHRSCSRSRGNDAPL